MQPFYKFLKVVIPFSIVLFFLQNYIVTVFFKNFSFFYFTSSIFIFHSIITLFSYGFLVFVHTNIPEKTGFAFMGFSLIKMMAAIVFLIPLLQSDLESKIPDVSAFFIPYFLFLFLETFLVIRLIHKH